jgi:hypothetical protein
VTAFRAVAAATAISVESSGDLDDRVPERRDPLRHLTVIRSHPLLRQGTQVRAALQHQGGSHAADVVYRRVR